MAGMDSVLSRLVDRYERRGQAITVNFRSIVPDLSKTDRLTHQVHPYPAKLLAHIPHFFLNCHSLSKPGDKVLDPFCGSGTVLLEAQIAGRVPIGADVNPLARLIAKVKTTPIDPQQLSDALEVILARVDNMTSTRPSRQPDIPNIEHWFYPHVIRDLCKLRDAIATLPNHSVRNFFAICLSVTARKASLADPRLAVPVRLCPHKYREGHPLRTKLAKHARSVRVLHTIDAFKTSCNANIVRMAEFFSLPPGVQANLDYMDAKRLRSMPKASVQLAITSPPYPGAQKYVRSSMFGLGWLDLCESSELIDYKRATIGREEFRKAELSRQYDDGVPGAATLLSRLRERNPARAAVAATYLIEMRDAIAELARVVKPGGYLVLVAANGVIAGRRFPTVRFLQSIAETVGFRVCLRLIDSIRSRGLMTKRNRTASVMSREWVILFQREHDIYVAN